MSLSPNCRERLIVFCKAPRPGLVKTRIAASLGPEAAANIYRELLNTVVQAVISVRDVELRYSPDDAQQELVSFRLHSEWRLVAQGPGDLGCRLQRALQSAFDEGCDRVVVVGTDAPELAGSDVHEAMEALRTSEVVLGPALDGGYWLIGLSAPQPSLFDGIPWSTAAVLGETRSRARTLGLRVHLLRPLSDIDTEADWQDFVRRKRGKIPDSH